jgi:hypothetical protein
MKTGMSFLSLVAVLGLGSAVGQQVSLQIPTYPSTLLCVMITAVGHEMKMS